MVLHVNKGPLFERTKKKQQKSFYNHSTKIHKPNLYRSQSVISGGKMLAEIFAPPFVGSEICRFGLSDRPPLSSIPFFAVKKKKKQIPRELIRLYKFILPEKPHPHRDAFGPWTYSQWG